MELGEITLCSLNGGRYLDLVHIPWLNLGLHQEMCYSMKLLTDDAQVANLLLQ